MLQHTSLYHGFWYKIAEDMDPNINSPIKNKLDLSIMWFFIWLPKTGILQVSVLPWNSVHIHVLQWPYNCKSHPSKKSHPDLSLSHFSTETQHRPTSVYSIIEHTQLVSASTLFLLGHSSPTAEQFFKNILEGF